MDLSRYAALFQTESREHLGACSQLLLDWERDPRATEPVVGIFRAMHTFKGMAAAMGYGNLTELAHRAENLLDVLRSDPGAATHELHDLLFAIVDALEAGVGEAIAGNDAQLDFKRAAGRSRPRGGGHPADRQLGHPRQGAGAGARAGGPRGAGHHPPGARRCAGPGR